MYGDDPYVYNKKLIMPPAAEQPAEQQEQGVLSQIMSNLPKYILIYMAINYFTQSFKPSLQNQPPNQPIPSTNPSNPLNLKQKPANYLAKYRFGEKFDFKFYISKSEKLDESAKLLVSKHVVFGEYVPFKQDLKVDCDHDLKNNGSLFGHYLLDHKDKPVYFKKLLTRFMPRKKVVVKKRLVSENVVNDAEKEPKRSDPKEIISYWWNNVTINLVQMQDPIPSNSPPQMLKPLVLVDNGNYLPIFSQNDFWMLSENLQPINQTCTGLTINFSWDPIAYWKFQMYTQFDESFKMQTELMGADVSEADTVKRMFLDTNPYLLGVTIIVSILHSVFDFLAFKNDISFWKDKKNMEGMSLRTIILNIIFQTITLLYLLDNDTSYMILVSSGIGILIEAWKIHKTMMTSRIPTFPYVKFTERYKPSKLTRKTQKYDRLAFNYLSYALFPLMLMYTGYSLVYESHKSWYSFVIGTMVGFVYTFGFISMTPQLFINYKLKSVAHMPGKTFMYKALNTFIDDLFAFVIKMPWLHRLACLRDDLVFFVYLYQRWIYKEDKRRRNEFGQVGEDDGVVDDEDLLSSDDEDIVKEKNSIKEKSIEKTVNTGTALDKTAVEEVKKRKTKKSE